MSIKTDNLKKIMAAFEGVELTGEEAMVFGWLAGQDRDTVEHIIRAAQKLRELENGQEE